MKNRAPVVVGVFYRGNYNAVIRRVYDICSFRVDFFTVESKYKYAKINLRLLST